MPDFSGSFLLRWAALGCSEQDWSGESTTDFAFDGGTRRRYTRV